MCELRTRYSVGQNESEKIHRYSWRLVARLEDVGIHLLKNREMLQHEVMKRILAMQRRVPGEELHSNCNRLLELLCIIDMDCVISLLSRMLSERILMTSLTCEKLNTMNTLSQR